MALFCTEDCESSSMSSSTGRSSCLSYSFSSSSWVDSARYYPMERFSLPHMLQLFLRSSISLRVLCTLTTAMGSSIASLANINSTNRTAWQYLTFLEWYLHQSSMLSYSAYFMELGLPLSCIKIYWSLKTARIWPGSQVHRPIRSSYLYFSTGGTGRPYALPKPLCSWTSSPSSSPYPS